MSDLGEGTQLSSRQLVTYGPNVEAGISKHYYLRPECPVHLTHRTLRTQTDVLDAMLDRRRIRKITPSSSHVLTPSQHGPLRPVRPDDV